MTNEELQQVIAQADFRLDKMKDDIHDLFDENKQLKERINNALDYIKWHYDLATEKNVEFCLLRDRLLEILGGKENDK